MSINPTLIKQPNNWSCIAVAFAMALDISLNEFIDRVGHDGGEVLCGDGSESGHRRGFHVQECIAVALELGKSVTPFEAVPVISHYTEIHVLRKGGNESSFLKVLYTTSGVVTGRGANYPHAVAYTPQVVLDPKGIIYPNLLRNMPLNTFTPQCAWIIR